MAFSKTRVVPAFLVLTSALVLTSCFRNSIDEVQLSVKDHSVCAGGLKASFKVGSLEIEATEPIDGFGTWVNGSRPADAPEGAPATVEAWCYDEGAVELGYARVEQAWHAPQGADIPTIRVDVGDEVENYPHCLPVVERRGQAPCINSKLLD